MIKCEYCGRTSLELISNCDGCGTRHLDLLPGMMSGISGIQPVLMGRPE